jgi:hypothetical protein
LSLCFYLILASTHPPAAQNQSLDPAFAKVPFDQWFSGGKQASFRWSAHIFPPRLSHHQRLLTMIRLQVDGADLAKRRGKGELLMLFQVKDAEGRRFQDHGIVDLEKLDQNIKSSDIIYTESVFVMPGDYHLALALYDTATGEHSVKAEKFHVPPLKNDPLPELWRDLPPVEVVPIADPPDGWFLPTLRGRLRAASNTQHPLVIDVIVNVTPTERLTGRRAFQDTNLGVLISPLRTIAEARPANASMNVELVDVARQRVLFRQDGFRIPDWERMKASLTPQMSATIDVQSLEDRRQDAAFLVREIEQRIAGGDRSSTIVVVLSRPVSFESGQDLPPIEQSARSGTKVFYLRCHSQWNIQPGSAHEYAAEAAASRRGGGMISRGPARLPLETLPDQLAPLLDLFAPRLYDIESPEQFRKALATILAEISSM